MTRPHLLITLLILYTFLVTLYASGQHIELQKLRDLPHVVDQRQKVRQLEDRVNYWKMKYDQAVHPKWSEGEPLK